MAIWWIVYSFTIDTTKTIEVEKIIYNDRYFYTWFVPEYKIWDEWFIFNKDIQWYEKIHICWFSLLNNDLQEWEYLYLVSKDSCYDQADMKTVFKYNLYKTLE